MHARPIGEKPQESWLRKFVVIDYLDGLVEAVAECPEGHPALVKMVAWDANQDIRVYVVFELPSQTFGEIEGLLADEEKRWPLAFPDWAKDVALDECVADILDASKRKEPDYFVIAKYLDREILLSGEVGEGEDWEKHDWQDDLSRMKMANRR